MEDLLNLDNIASEEENSNEQNDIFDNTIEVENNNGIKKVQISLATREDILEWSSGEVTKPETKIRKQRKGGKSCTFFTK